MGETFGEITDEELNEAFNRVKEKFNGYDIMRESFYEIRDGIGDIVKTCSKNVKVVIYVNDVLDSPITVQSGNAENRLRITIKSRGRVSYSWTKETWGKVFRDAWIGIKSLLQRILTFIASNARSLLGLGQAALAAIGF
ncbi:uncharacterized protein LOC133196507 [Saccostrea echinata]|uniref:uncharacterized protein LOC133196507 n=1 Tax=Saccostrea echinata TaxID=191078 RepID=UPI002A8062C6|nr:uncharacterized protein LOC133196507 [Saccostrea echinata]